MLPVGLQYPHTEGTKEGNKQKNRYLTTFPCKIYYIIYTYDKY